MVDFTFFDGALGFFLVAFSPNPVVESNLTVFLFTRLEILFSFTNSYAFLATIESIFAFVIFVTLAVLFLGLRLL